MGFHMDNSTLVKYEGDDTDVVISDGVTSIGDRAFSECTRLTSVIIPEGVTNIGEYAFSKCAGLKSITIPESVTSIGTHHCERSEQHHCGLPQHHSLQTLEIMV